jgi:apolipoprotein N-acyltransferase
MGLWISAFTPTPSAWGTLPAFVAFLALIERCRRTRHAVGYLVLFGAVAVGFGYRWLAPTVRAFGEFDARIGAWGLPVSWLVLGVYGIAGTIHGVIFVILYRKLLLPGPTRPHPFATVLLFAACEALPIRFLPWMAGYGAVETAPLRQVAEWAGVSGVSIALLCLCAPFHEWIRWARGDRARGAPARPLAALATFAVGALLYGAGWWRLGQVSEEDRAATRTVRIGIVQANVGNALKRAAERDGADERRTSHEGYERGTRRAAAAGAELIVWPETAIAEGVRIFDPKAGRMLPAAAAAQSLSRAGYDFVADLGRDRTLLLGGYEDEDTGDAVDAAGRPIPRRYNCAMLREPGGASWEIYRKVKLVPFGESMPGASIFPSLADLLPQHFRMSPGASDQTALPWRAKGLTLATFICYEAIQPEMVAAICGGERPDLLVNLTNDSWFGSGWEPDQHLNFSRFRAVEHRAPLVRATNTGISAFVSATGEVLASLPYDTVGELVRDVPIVARGRTLYSRLAGWSRVGLGAAALAVLVSRRRARRRARSAARPSIT